VASREMNMTLRDIKKKTVDKKEEIKAK